MRSLACLITSALLLLGLAGIAQAQNGCHEYVVLECKSTKKGGFEVFAYSNDGGNGADIEIGEPVVYYDALMPGGTCYFLVGKQAREEAEDENEGHSDRAYPAHKKTPYSEHWSFKPGFILDQLLVRTPADKDRG